MAQHQQSQLQHLLLVELILLLLVLHLLVSMLLVVIFSRQFMLTIQAEDIVLLQQLLLQIQKHLVVLERISLMKSSLEKGLRLRRELKNGIKIQRYSKYPMSALDPLNSDSSQEKLSEEKTLEQSIHCSPSIKMIYTMSILKMISLNLKQMIS